MSQILGVIAGLGHCPQREEFDGIVFRSVLSRCKKAVEFPGYLPAVCGRSHLVAEVAYEVTQVVNLLLVWLVMHTIDKGLSRLSATLCLSLADSLAACGHKLRDRPVGKEHELLDQPVSLLGNLLIHIHRASLLIHNDLHLRSFETDGSAGKPLLPES